MGRVTVLCAATALCILAMAAIVLETWIGEDWTLGSCVARVVVAVPLLVCAIFLGDICTLRPSDSHSAWTLMTQYVLLRITTIYTSRVYVKFINGCKNIRQAQSEFLLKTLRDNSKTDYGLRFQLGSIKTREKFVKLHPLTTYKHYEQYIERVCHGEDNVMSPKKLEFVAMSSGTTGKFKQIPVFAGASFQLMTNLGFFLNHITTKVKTLQRIVVMRLKATDRFTYSGVRSGPASCHFSPLPPYAVTPKGAGAIQSEGTQCYVTALLALAEKDVQYFDFMLAPMCFAFFGAIEQNSEQLVRDLKSGSLYEGLDVTPDVRTVVSKCLKSNPLRAVEVSQELSQGNDRLAMRLWPQLKMVGMNTTGEFEATARLLRASTLKDVFIKTFMHTASEGTIGIVPNATNDSMNEHENYAFSHSTVFLEFIPEECIAEDNPATLFMDQLEIGRSYEVVVTNSNGLYRYRLGDVIRVTGFLHQNPLYEFMYRSGQLLSVKGEKTSSSAFYEALRISELKWNGKRLLNYSATEGSSLELVAEFKGFAKVNRYFLFIEVAYLDNKTEASCLLNQDEKSMIDQHLQKLSKTYGVCRKNGSILPMEVIQVKPGAFAELKTIMIRDTNNQQYKTPRALRKPDLLTFMMSNDVTKTSYSSHNHLCASEC